MWTDDVSESKVVCCMGFHHVEITSQECVGKLLARSDWDQMFSLANIFTSVVAASISDGKHVKHTRYAY